MRIIPLVSTCTSHNPFFLAEEVRQSNFLPPSLWPALQSRGKGEAKKAFTSSLLQEFCSSLSCQVTQAREDSLKQVILSQVSAHFPGMAEIPYFPSDRLDEPSKTDGMEWTRPTPSSTAVRGSTKQTWRRRRSNQR